MRTDNCELRTTLERFLREIRSISASDRADQKAKNILVTTHTRPDGDACGCVAAVTEVLRGLGKTVRPLLLSPMPDWYAFLFEEKVPVLGQDVQVEDLTGGRFGPIDLVIIVDTNSYSQLPRFEDLSQAEHHAGPGDRPSRRRRQAGPGADRG